MLKPSHARKFTRSLLLTLCIFFVCVTPVVVNMVYNDIRNHQYANLLYDYPLPPDTEKLSEATECFCPHNGGTCAVAFSEILLTSLNEEQVKAYYAEVWFPPLWKAPIPEEYQRVNVDLDFGYPQHTDERIQFKASIGEAFYHPGLFDWRCTQR